MSDTSITAPFDSSVGEPHAFWWLWFPPLMLIVAVSFYLLDRPFYQRWIDGELGLIELATVVVLAPGVVLGALIWRRREQLPDWRLRLWMPLVALGCLYFAGEELSWGQHLLGWQTPEPMQAINDQQETNIHNISSWFDQKPRTLLELWVLVGGIVLPLWTSLRGVSYFRNDWRYWFWPSRVCLPTAVLAILIRIPERFHDWFDMPRPPPLDMRVSELQEYYFGLFLSLYLVSVYARIKETGNRRM